MSVEVIFGPMKFVMKHFGFNPLFGLFTNEFAAKPRTMTVISHLFFLTQLTTVLITSYQMYFAYNFQQFKGLVYFGTFLFSHLFYCMICIGHFFIAFRMKTRLANYLQMFSGVETLLKPREKSLRNVITCSFFIICALGLLMVFLFSYNATCTSNCDNFWFIKQVITTLMYTFTQFGAFYQPSFLYVCFQLILKSCFQELHQLIQKFKDEENFSIQKLGEFRRLYLKLCKLCKHLDYLVHPLLFIRFIDNFALTVADIALDEDYVAYVINISSILFPPIFAQFTLNEAVKILPEIFSAFEFEGKDYKNEIEMICFQSLYFQPAFSASGFFVINGNLIFSMVESIISYIVVFSKICHSF